MSESNLNQVLMSLGLSLGKEFRVLRCGLYLEPARTPC